MDSERPRVLADVERAQEFFVADHAKRLPPDFVWHREMSLEIDRAAKQEDGRIPIAISSEHPVERYDWWEGEAYIEILDHNEKAVDLSWARDGMAFLMDHNTRHQIGLLENVTVDKDKRMRGMLRMGNHPDAVWVEKDMRAGIRKKVSVGYRLSEEYTKSVENGVTTRRYHKWYPLEGSSVSVPADYAVGVGRSASQPVASSKSDGTVGDQRPVNRHKQEEAKMSDAAEKSGTADNAGGSDALVDGFRASESVARANERKLIAKRNDSIIELGGMWPQYGGPDLALKAIANPDMTVDSFRASLMKQIYEKHEKPSNTGQLEADRMSPDHQQPASGAAPYGMSAREMIEGCNLKEFKGVGARLGKTDLEIAVRAGRWCQAVLHGNARAMQWCRDAGVQLHQGPSDQFSQRTMLEGSFTSAGWLVPVEMETAIIINREQYGVARRIANVIPMTTAQTTIPRVTSDTSAYFTGEGTPIPESESGGDQVTLTLKDLHTMTKFGKSTAQDTVIALAEFVTREQARAFAIKEDACLFIGNGTSTFGGMMGIKTLLDNAAYLGGVAVAAAGHNLITELDILDITAALGKLPVYARPGARWVCSGAFDVAVFGRLKLNAGGNTVQTVQGAIVEGDYAGFPVTLAHHMPAGVGDDNAGLTVLLVGNFNLGVAFGSGSGMMMTVDPYTLADLNLTRVITTERIDINAHGVNHSTTVAGPIIGLRATT